MSTGGKAAISAGIELGGELVKAGVDVKTSGVKYVGAKDKERRKDLGEAVIDLTTGVVGGQIAKQAGKGAGELATDRKVVNAAKGEKKAGERQLKQAQTAKGKAQSQSKINSGEKKLAKVQKNAEAASAVAERAATVKANEKGEETKKYYGY